jgi:hypothetical protein
VSKVTSDELSAKQILVPSIFSLQNQKLDDHWCGETPAVQQFSGKKTGLHYRKSNCALESTSPFSKKNEIWQKKILFLTGKSPKELNQSAAFKFAILSTRMSVDFQAVQLTSIKSINQALGDPVNQ